MRIIAIIGRVLDPRGIVVNRRAGRIFVNREEYLMQPADRCALEAALRIKETVRAEVVALPRSLLPDDEVLRQALSTGADRAIHLVGRVDLSYDDAVMVRVVAAAIQRFGGADLVLVGATTLDTNQSQLGPRLAEALGWPVIAFAWQVDTGDGKVQAVVRQENGHVTVEAALPAVVTVVPGAFKPRYPDGVRLINVYRDPNAVECWDVGDLIGEAALQPLIERRGQDFPPERERGVRFSGTPEELAGILKTIDFGSL